ncbi:hypothetical protein A1O7_07993, partial [Cladophialophora yegresii CBS 114405]
HRRLLHPHQPHYGSDCLDPRGRYLQVGRGIVLPRKGHTLDEEVEGDFAATAKASSLTYAEVKNAFNRNIISGSFLADGPSGLESNGIDVCYMTHMPIESIGILTCD